MHNEADTIQALRMAVKLWLSLCFCWLKTIIFDHFNWPSGRLGIFGNPYLASQAIPFHHPTGFYRRWRLRKRYSKHLIYFGRIILGGEIASWRRGNLLHNR